MLVEAVEAMEMSLVLLAQGVAGGGGKGASRVVLILLLEQPILVEVVVVVSHAISKWCGWWFWHCHHLLPNCKRHSY